ncbi:MAG: Dolichyl-phosphate-mannose-protein mannosyltransferase, partial [Verrucomicrobiota bacterium]
MPTGPYSSQQTSAALGPGKIDILKAAELVVAILLSAVVIVLLIIRATHAGALWRDEAATLHLAQMPTLGDVAANFQHEAFPLPFPLLIRTYVALFGASDASLRWFGFVIGVAMVAVAWFNSRAINDRGPLLFLTLFGLNATFLIWGTSLRGYGIGCVFLILTVGLTTTAVRQPTRTNAVAATIASIGAVQFMINAVPLIAAIATAAALVFLFRRQSRRAMIVCVCAAICALSFLPYAHSYLNADWSIVLKYPADFASLWEKFQLAEYPAWIFWRIGVPLVFIATISRLWILRREKSSAEAQLLLYLAAVTALSIFAYYAFLRILSYATRPWYYLPLLCAVAGAIDLMGGILSRTPWIRIARLLVVIAALLLLPFALWKSARQHLTDIDIVAHKLEQEAGPNDLIVLNPWSFAPSFYRYYHGSTPWITVPTMSEHRIHRYDLMKSKTMETDPLSDVRSAIQQTLQAQHRVWIVGGAQPADENMPRLGPAPNPYFGWAGYMNFWSMELGSFLKQHAA